MNALDEKTGAKRKTKMSNKNHPQENIVSIAPTINSQD
jgi:hypothetical protein